MNMNGNMMIVLSHRMRNLLFMNYMSEIFLVEKRIHLLVGNLKMSQRKLVI